MTDFLQDPERRREIFLSEVVSLVRREEIRKKLAKQVVGMAWNLAEAKIKLEQGEFGFQEKVNTLTQKLEETDLGKGILKLKDQMIDAIKNNKEATRQGLAKYLRRN